MIETLNNEELKTFVFKKVEDFKSNLKEFKIGNDYYHNKHAILEKKRLAVGEDGILVELHNLPNNKIIDNQYKRLVDQKINYILSRLPTVNSDENEKYAEIVKKFINRRFLRTLNTVAIDTLNYGIGWLYCYLKEGKLKVKRVDPEEIIPIWTDNNRDKLYGIIRIRTVDKFDSNRTAQEEYVELYLEDRIVIYKEKNKRTKEIEERVLSYANIDGNSYSWGKLPFIYFKQKNEEKLLDSVKSLQDTINVLISNYADMLLEDPRSSIMVIKNYDGQDLGEFRQNLATYGAVKVRSDVGGDGDLKTLEVDINAETYKVILDMLKEKLIEAGKGLDAKQQRSGHAPNMINIKSMYTDIELDANSLELEFQASFEYMQYFIKTANGLSEDTEEIEIEFKRNIMINESEEIDNVVKSVGLVSNQTLLRQHPFVNNVEIEMEQLEEEREKEIESMAGYGFGELKRMEEKNEATE